MTENASCVADSLAARIGPTGYGALAGSILVAAIWMPDFVKSSRVEATFIR